MRILLLALFDLIKTKALIFLYLDNNALTFVPLFEIILIVG